MGTVLACLLVAGSRMRAGFRSIERRSHACVLADELLEQFWQDPSTLPLNGSGSVSERRQWRWRTQQVMIPSGDFHKITLEVYHEDFPECKALVEILVPRHEDAVESSG